MFNFNLNLITCDYPLPIPEESLNDMENPPDWEEMEFNFEENASISDNMLSKFSIESDGLIYEEVREIEINEKGEVEPRSVGVEKKEYTGEILFHGLHLEEKYDFLMSFKALFWKGDLKEIKLFEWKKEDNTERVEFQEKTKEKFKEELDKKKKWWYKPLLLVSRPPRYALLLCAKFLGFLLRCISKIESRLA